MWILSGVVCFYNVCGCFVLHFGFGERERGGGGVGLYVAVCYKLFSYLYKKTVYILLFSSIVQEVEASLFWKRMTISNINSLYITNAAGSINISNILTGKCLAKIRASNSFPMENECSCSGNCCGSSCALKKQSPASRIRSTVAEALEDITALFYDEERNEIYTGNRHGLVHVWSNWWFLYLFLVIFRFILPLFYRWIDCSAAPWEWELYHLMLSYQFFFSLFIRLHLATCKIFSECKIFSGENIFGKGKYVQVFGCIMKIVSENVFRCLVAFWKCYFPTSFLHFLNFQTNFVIENFNK